MTLIGDRRKLAAEVGSPDTALGAFPGAYAHPAEAPFRRVDLWAANQWITCDDNLVHTPQFHSSVRRTATSLHPAEGPNGQLSERFPGFLDWGATTDNVMACLVRTGDLLTITLEFWRPEHLRTHLEHDGTVFTTEIHQTEFLEVLDQLVATLDRVLLD